MWDSNIDGLHGWRVSCIDAYSKVPEELGPLGRHLLDFLHEVLPYLEGTSRCAWVVK